MIRNVELRDFISINHIKKVLALDTQKIREDNQYRYSIQDSGFLLKTEDSQKAFEKDLSKIFLTYEVEGNISAYIRIDDQQEMNKQTKVFWLDSRLSDVYFSEPHALIGGLGVLPKARDKGIARTLLAEAEKRLAVLGIRTLFSFVVLSPVTNTPSILFHERMGFCRAAITMPRPLFGMDGYQSILYYKNI